MEAHLETAGGTIGKALKSAGEIATWRQADAHDTGMRKKQERHH